MAEGSERLCNPWVLQTAGSDSAVWVLLKSQHLNSLCSDAGLGNIGFEGRKGPVRGAAGKGRVVPQSPSSARELETGFSGTEAPCLSSYIYL